MTEPEGPPPALTGTAEEFRTAAAEKLYQLTDDKTRLHFAKIGLMALIDEATGFQADRPKDALISRLAELSEEKSP